MKNFWSEAENKAKGASQTLGDAQFDFANAEKYAYEGIYSQVSRNLRVFFMFDFDCEICYIWCVFI